MGQFSDIFVATLHGRQVLNELSTLHEKVNQTDLCTFHTIGFTDSSIARLLSQFSKIDTDHSGTICLDELMEYFELDQTRFVARVFDVMDEDGKGTIDFREFVISCYNYCSLDQESMVTFEFDLYDVDSSGSIDFYEVELMLTEVYSSNFQSNRNAVALLQNIREWKIGVGGPTSKRCLCNISFQDFKRFSKTHNLLLFPAFLLQQTLRRKLLSRGFWERCTKRRKELPKANRTTGNLNEIRQIENQVKQRLSILDIERRSSNVTGSGFGGQLCKRVKNWRRTNIAKKELAAIQLEKYVMTQIKTTQGPICDRVRAREEYKDEQQLPPELRTTKRTSRNSYKLDNQGGGFRYESVLCGGPITSEDHANNNAVVENGKEIQRGSMITALANLLGIGRTGRASAVVDILSSDEVGGTKRSIGEERNKHPTNNKSDRPHSSGGGDMHISGTAGLLPTIKKISIEPPPPVKTHSGGIHTFFPSNQGSRGSILNSTSSNAKKRGGSPESVKHSLSNMERDAELHYSPSTQGSAESFTPTTKRRSAQRMSAELQRPGSFGSLSSIDTQDSLNYSTPQIRSSITPQDVQRKSYRRSVKLPGMISTL